MFFDRGLADASAALGDLTGEPVLARLGTRCRYDRRVYLAPPWPEIYRTDDKRRHSFDDAIVEYERLLRAYPSLGYELTMLPKANVRKRPDWLLATLDAD